MTILCAEMVFWTKAASGESADDTQQRDAAITKIDAIKIFSAIEALDICLSLSRNRDCYACKLDLHLPFLVSAQYIFFSFSYSPTFSFIYLIILIIWPIHFYQTSPMDLPIHRYIFIM